jgi:trehalose-6-phosphate synthase
MSCILYNVAIKKELARKHLEDKGNGQRKMTARLWVVSNRLPVTLTRKIDGWDMVKSSGGLVSALDGLKQSTSFIWLGWPGMHLIN